MRTTVLPFCAVAAASAAASAQVFNFDYPNFTPTESTPLLNRSPDVGPFTGITANFTTTGAAMYVAPDDPAAQPNGLMSGQFLVAPNGTNLIISFSQPVTSIDFDFAVNSTTSGSSLSWYLPASGTPGVQAATNVGGGLGYWGGHVSIHGLVGVQQILLSATNANQTRIEFAIDNLAVPTPGAAAALTLGALGSFRRRR